MLTRTVSLPTLPRVVQGAGGPIRVRLVKVAALEDKVPCWGVWEPERRLVKIDRAAPKAHQWRILYHELTHAALHDAGLSHLLTDDAEESLCDAMATARMAELLVNARG
jgi:Zn-dependent peptidase ImmA (M78 family)